MWPYSTGRGKGGGSNVIIMGGEGVSEWWTSGTVWMTMELPPVFMSWSWRLELENIEKLEIFIWPLLLEFSMDRHETWSEH